MDSNTEFKARTSFDRVVKCTRQMEMTYQERQEIEGDLAFLGDLITDLDKQVLELQQLADLEE